MRTAILGCVIVLAACGGGGASSATSRPGTATEPPQLVAARAKHDAVCACTDAPCVNRVVTGPLGREVEGPAIEDPAALRLLIGLGQKTVECMYRGIGVPAVCLAMVRAANALSDCPAVTEEQTDSLAKTMQETTGTWTQIAWRTMPAEQTREYERVCEEIAATLGSLSGECAEPSPGSKP